MPLAIKRLKAEEFPVAFQLDDSMAMSRGVRLSDHAEVRIVARISKTGGATPSSGDLQRMASGVKAGAGAVELVIDRAIP